jgi:DNA repair protein RadC
LAERLRQKPALESPVVVRDYLKSMLRHEPHEVFGCLFLDSNIGAEFRGAVSGSIDNTSVHPREVVKRALATTRRR